MCSGPLSPPTKSAARSISARRSVSEKPSPSTMRRPRVTGPGARGGDHARRRLAIGRAAGHHHPSFLSGGHEIGGQVGERLFGPAPERVARAHVQDDQRRVVRDTPAWSAAPRRPARLVRHRHRHAIARRIGRRQLRVEGAQQVPLVLDRVPRPELARSMDDMRVHPGPAGDIVAHPDGAPASPTSAIALRGPPCRSSTTSNLRRRRSAESRRSSRTRCQPAAVRARR